MYNAVQAADSEINLVHSRYAKNDTSKVLWAIFEIDKLTSRKPKVLEYKIRSSEIGENQMIMMHEEDPAYKDPYILSGFMALQIAIEKSFVEMWTNPTLPKIADNLTIGRFPFYKVNFLILPYVIRPNISIIYYVMVIAFLLLPAATLRRALHDKETGFRGLMRLTNISFTMLYIGWLNYLMIILLPVTIVCTILLFSVFSAANALVIAIFIMMYNILSMFVMFTISTLFDHPKLFQSIKIGFIMPKFTNFEMADMHFAYGLANGNSRNTIDLGKPMTVRTPVLEEAVLNEIEAHPETSTRKIARTLNVSNYVIWRILKEQQLYPYHIQRVQRLLPCDFPQRLAFCQWILQKLEENPQFLSQVLFTDEANFSRNAIINFHNNHLWSDDNPYTIIESRFHQQFSLNVWVDIVDDFLIGPYFLPLRFDGVLYRKFLEEDLPQLLQEVPLMMRHTMWFMHDDAPAHFSITVPTKALLTSVLFWLFLTHLTIVLDQFLITESMLWRISSLILPHSGLLYGIVAFTTYTNFDDYSENLRNIWQHTQVKPRNYIGPTSYLWPRWLSELITLRDAHNIVHAAEKISISLILFVWILHIIFWYLLAVYLDNVNPGKFGSAKPWYYLFKKPVYDDNDLIIRGSTNWSAVEHTPSYIKPSIRVRCVRKEFGRIGERITAVNDVTIDFYNQEFSVILGHNGAGKSCLLKIIIGMYKPTHGHVYLENESSIYPIGYCPQENILVNYLTTIQHLYIFGMIKGMTYEDAYKESLKLLKQLDLEYVKDTKMKSCSFGTRRRICLAMALIGNTKILILDEPTYSIDPEHKRQIWDLLLDIKRYKTIIMATNSMEAADFLADRIAIIANGRIECYGSKMYLNRRYGIGYVLSLLIQEDCNVEQIRTEIQEFSADPITLRSMMGLVIRFDVPRNSRFTKLLQHLEFNKEELKIVSVALSAASIEGQFLRISLESQFKERSVKLPSNKYELIVQQRRRHLLQTAKPWKRLTGDALWRQQILAMFLKKLLHIASSWKIYIFSITLAVITLILATIIAELSNFTLFDTTERVMNLTSYMDNNFHVLYYAADDKSIKDFLATLYVTSQTYSERHNYHISKNIPATDLMVQPDLHSIEFRDRYVMSIDMYTDGRVQLMYSSTAVHSGPIALNLLHNALLRYHCGSDNCWIKLTSRPLLRSGQWQHLLVHTRSVRNWENAAIIITLFLLLPSIDMGIREKNTRSKMLQTNAIGMSTRIYWIPTYIIDFLLYAFSIIFFGITILSVYHRTLHFSNLEIVQMLMIFLCYGGCAIPLSYCVQLFTRKPENAYLSVILINIVTMLLVNSSVIFPLIFRVLSSVVRYTLEVLIHILPPYILACALSNYITLNLYNRQCSYFNTCDTEFYIEDPCCQNCKGKDCYKHLDVMLIKQSSFEYNHSVTDDILLMVSLMFAFYILLEVFEEKNRRKWYSYFVPLKKDDDILESEVMQEKKRVEEYMKHYDETKLLPSRVALVVQNLTKEYAKEAIIQGINFSIHNQECFGLLGFNGAGKSTIYKALVGQIKMSAGKAVIYEYEFTRNQEMFVGMIGYCPQINGLSDFMTGRQYLQLHAALRGVPYESINEEVNKWLDVLDMLDFENLKIAHYPWGIQRKLCILQSLTGDLPMIFMDEPSAGIDIMTRHAICEILHQIREMGRSILITTHSMPEAEAMCLRIGILVNGQFTAIGSCEYLKAKYGRNFILNIKIIPGYQFTNLEKIKKIINETFPTIRFKDSYLGVLKYELESGISYSYVFDKLEKLRQRYVWITDFSVTQPSMDEVFLTLAKKQRKSQKKLTLYERLRSCIIESGFCEERFTKRECYAVRVIQKTTRQNCFFQQAKAWQSYAISLLHSLIQHALRQRRLRRITCFAFQQCVSRINRTIANSSQFTGTEPIARTRAAGSFPPKTKDERRKTVEGQLSCEGPSGIL
ncbi:PREDICTED: ATP-binding cassette sub-family A member 2-like [Trachymyrmex cornetzi]|uniref:ATP-binding cassette sub-family A member 2-like n=1 Tax=Trachymyrmex cornetzi TaxID=471704 RepID=UPI00084F3D22|nr:PREDICTED: ATP-binding cassette sub-family A member 2-like [Trachymyrmex cornetzi]